MKLDSRAALLIASGIALLLLCGRDFWDPDEPRFAEVAREMLRSGDWVLPRFNGEPLALLPPLTYWASAAASLPFGDVTEYSARIPVVLFALLALAGTMLIPEHGGFTSGVVLLTSGRFLFQAGRLQADMLLVGAQTWALAALYRAYVQPERRGRWLLSAYVAIALGVLAKGPLGALLPAAVFGLFLLWQHDLRALGRLGIAWGVPLVALLVAPWYATACARGGEAFCRELVLKHNLGMFFDTWSHSRGVFYYALYLPLIFLPWTLFVPSAVRRLRLDRETRFLLTWIAFTFVFFSASDAKQSKYLLPILPPLAILVARWVESGEPIRALRIGAASIGAAVAGAALAGYWIIPAAYPEIPARALLLALPACALSLAATIAVRPQRVAGLLATGIVASALAAQALAIPAVETYKSPRALTQTALALGQPTAIYGIAQRQIGGLVFYSGRELPLLASEEAFHEYMSAPEPRLAYVSRKAYGGGYSVVAESPYREGTVLVSNRGKTS